MSCWAQVAWDIKPAMTHVTDWNWYSMQSFMYDEDIDEYITSSPEHQSGFITLALSLTISAIFGICLPWALNSYYLHQIADYRLELILEDVTLRRWAVRILQLSDELFAIYGAKKSSGLTERWYTRSISCLCL